MKYLLIALLSLTTAPAFASDDAPAECDRNYTVKCQCENMGSIDAFQIYVVEKCESKENWVLLDRTQYSKEDCNAAIRTNEVCQSLEQ
jgi:hypothetical protein